MTLDDITKQSESILESYQVQTDFDKEVGEIYQSFRKKMKSNHPTDQVGKLKNNGNENDDGDDDDDDDDDYVPIDYANWTSRSLY